MNDDYFFFDLIETNDPDRMQLSVEESYNGTNGRGYSCELFRLTNAEMKELYDLLYKHLSENTDLLARIEC